MAQHAVNGGVGPDSDDFDLREWIRETAAAKRERVAILADLKGIKAKLVEHERKLSLWGFVGAAAGTIVAQIVARIFGGH